MNIDLSIEDVELLYSALKKELDSISQSQEDGKQYRATLKLRHRFEGLLSLFSTQCLACGTEDRLYVVNLTMAQSGKCYIIAEKLEPDGFSLPQRILNAESDTSTENEIVECEHCGYRCNLVQLLRDGG